MPGDNYARLPDPGQAGSLADLVERLQRLKIWAGNPSYERIKDRVNAAWTAAGRPAGELVCKSTVAYCFRPGRRRVDTDLVLAVVQALYPDVGYVAQWRQALRVVLAEAGAVSQVRVQDSLPQDLAAFTGRAGELRRLRRAARSGEAVVISAIEGMAGVGKTRLAVHAGHVLHGEQPFDRVLFVDLRGFHPGPDQPPADPAAVLDGFLRLLGVPGEQIPHDLDGRAAAYRDRLAGTRALVVLDNAGTAEQVRPLLAAGPGSLTVVTSRRRLAGLEPAAHLTLDVFSPGEATAFVREAAPEVPVGADPDAAARIARRCGYLPLALGLVTGHIRATSDWTLTDHAERLDERHLSRRLEAGVELALDLSYHHLEAGARCLLRLAALHPGPDFDTHAAAALTGGGLPAVRDRLRDLCRDHLLLPAGRDRYTFHDLVRAYAAGRAVDEDSPSARRAALTRLFDHYLSTAAVAMDVLHPGEAHRRPRIAPATRGPALTDPEAARNWLDGERHNLVSVAAHTARHGWPTHTMRLSATLYRYLSGGHYADGLGIHGYAREAARGLGDARGQADALVGIGWISAQLGRHASAADQLQQALALFRKEGVIAGEARALNNLGAVEERRGRYPEAIEHYERALALHRRAGDRNGEARALNNLAVVEERLGRYRAAVDHHEQAIVLYRRAGDRAGEAVALSDLGDVEGKLGLHEPAIAHLRQALALIRELGTRSNEAWALDSLGTVQGRIGRLDAATDCYRQALAIHRETGDRHGESWALNGLGEAARAAGCPAGALAHHRAAHAIATSTGDRYQQARAHTGLAAAHHDLGDVACSREHYRQAWRLYTDLGMPEAAEIRAHLS
ncbi:ATP-binding protein [Actinoplanes sp. CA-030573]|uniref:ATP-binding protein n=1 Tax=Actinoplanes sp. CA-030573 TaxID=3239898 RepID=UPI003D9433FF